MAIALHEEEDQHQQQPKRIRSHSSETLEDPLFPTLLPEIIVEILARLPVESLLQCKSICKLWYSMISDPHFVKSHLTLSTNNTRYAHHRLIYYNAPSLNIKSGLLYDVLHDGSFNATELDCPLKDTYRFFPIAVSCDGLVLLREVIKLLIWNPSTRRSKSLPLPYGFKGRYDWYASYGFGYDASTDDHKVIEVASLLNYGSSYETSYETRVRICSLKSGSWKNIGDFPHGVPLADAGKFCKGALHWVGSRDTGSSYSRTIVSLDLANETFGEILQPVYDERYNYRTLGALEEWLCVLCNYRGIRADVWLMKDYGVRDSWTKLVSIPYLTDPGRTQYSVPLFITNDGKVLLQFGAKLVVYDPKNRSFSEIRNLDECMEAFTFVKSLVSPS